MLGRLNGRYRFRGGLAPITAPERFSTGVTQLTPSDELHHIRRLFERWQTTVSDGFHD
jgi:hypothetical protein